MRRSELPIENPCSADWDAMVGDDRRRFCGHCRKHVHNLSAMVEQDAHGLLQTHRAGGLCVTYASDASGRILFRPPARRLRLPVLAGVGGAVLAACGPTPDDGLTHAGAALRTDAAAADAGDDEDAGSDGAGSTTSADADPWGTTAPAADAHALPTTPGPGDDAPCEGKPETPPHASDGDADALDAAPEVVRGRVATPPLEVTMGEPLPVRLQGDVRSPSQPIRVGKVMPRPTRPR